jgi:hypothetical protein
LTEVLADMPKYAPTGGRARRIAAAFLEGRPPAYDPEQLGAWMGAADWLVESGRLEEGKVILDVLNREQPGVEWAVNLSELLDRAPPLEPGAPVLADQLLNDFQVVARPGAEVAMILFCGARHRLGMSVSVMHRWLVRLGASLIYVRDFHGQSFLKGVASQGGDLASTMAALRRTMEGLGARRAVCLGCSGGGFGALRYAIELGGCGISMGSPTNMEPAFNQHMNHAAVAAQLKAAFPDEDLDLRRRIEAAAHPPRTLIVYGGKNWNERIHAEHMAGTPGAVLYPLAWYKGHATAPELIRRGELLPVLEAFIAGRPVAPPA